MRDLSWQGATLPDSCHCPTSSLEQWREDNQCPPPTQQMEDDLAKFSFGVYCTVSSLQPLEVWLHRELLVLLATSPPLACVGVLDARRGGSFEL